MTNDEQFLFEKLRSGDETALEVIYKRYAPGLFYFVHEYVPNTDIAEDIASWVPDFNDGESEHLIGSG